MNYEDDIFDQGFDFGKNNNSEEEDNVNALEQEELTDEELESEESQEDGEEDTEESGDEEQDTSNEDSGEDEEEFSYSPIIDHLSEIGLIPEDLDMEIDNSPEGLTELFTAIADKKFSDLTSSLSKDAQRLLEIEKAGGNIKEAFEEAFNDIDYNDINIDDEDVRKSLLTDYYKALNPKWNDERIERKVDTLFDAGDDEIEAKEAQEFFIERQELTKDELVNKAKQEKEQLDALYEQELEEYNNIINTSEGFAGIQFKSPKEKEDFRKYLFDVGSDGKTQAQRDDEDKKTVLTKEFHKFKKFNYTEVKKQAVTDATIKLKKFTQRVSDKNATAKGKQTNTRIDNPGTFRLGELDF